MLSLLYPRVKTQRYFVTLSYKFLDNDLLLNSFTKLKNKLYLSKRGGHFKNSFSLKMFPYNVSCIIHIIIVTHLTLSVALTHSNIPGHPFNQVKCPLMRGVAWGRFKVQCLYVTGKSQSVPAYEQCLLAEFPGAWNLLETKLLYPTKLQTLSCLLWPCVSLNTTGHSRRYLWSAEVFAFVKEGWHWCDHQVCLFPATGEDSLLYTVHHWLLWWCNSSL